MHEQCLPKWSILYLSYIVISERWSTAIYKVTELQRIVCYHVMMGCVVVLFYADIHIHKPMTMTSVDGRVHLYIIRSYISPPQFHLLVVLYIYIYISFSFYQRHVVCNGLFSCIKKYPKCVYLPNSKTYNTVLLSKCHCTLSTYCYLDSICNSVDQVTGPSLTQTAMCVNTYRYTQPSRL